MGFLPFEEEKSVEQQSKTSDVEEVAKEWMKMESWERDAKGFLESWRVFSFFLRPNQRVSCSELVLVHVGWFILQHWEGIS
jgi:hypothetical protein